jgi:hypothetical protein
LAEIIGYKEWHLSLKGCQIVAGGRSVAQTTGKQQKRVEYPGRVLEKLLGRLDLSIEEKYLS